MKSILSFTVAIVLTAGAASAAPPVSMANRTWILDIDGISMECGIDTRLDPGAGSGQLPHVAGKINGIAPISAGTAALSASLSPEISRSAIAYFPVSL